MMHIKRREVFRAAFAAPLALVASLRAPPVQAAASPAVGSALALVDLPLLEGGTFKASEANGRVLAIYWWASWCPFCAEMSPHVEKLWREHRARGLLVLGISIDKTAEAAIAHRRKRGYTVPSALHDPAMDRHFPKPRSVPTTWVRDRKGRVAMAVPGQMFPEDVADIAKFL